jgi:hypothetical protein
MLQKVVSHAVSLVAAAAVLKNRRHPLLRQATQRKWTCPLCHGLALHPKRRAKPCASLCPAVKPHPSRQTWAFAIWKPIYPKIMARLQAIARAIRHRTMLVLVQAVATNLQRILKP